MCAVDYSKSVNRISRNAARVAYMEVCKRGSATFANNIKVSKGIYKHLGKGLVGVRTDVRSSKGANEVFSYLWMGGGENVR